MKRIVAGLLSLVMFFGLSFGVSAQGDKESEYPIIIIPGFMQCSLHLNRDTDTSKKAWFTEMDTALTAIFKSVFHSIPTLSDIKRFLPTIENKFTVDPKELADLIRGIVTEVMPTLTYNTDGTSTNDVKAYENDPESRSFYSIMNSEMKTYMQAYYTFTKYICDNGYADEKNVFVFEYDGRSDAITLADELRTFVKDVKEYTGKDKVRIFGVSYGGQIAETYLHFYMDDMDVDKAVLNVPSLKGTDFAYVFFNGLVDLSFYECIDLLECVFESDTEYYKILKGMDNRYFSKILNSVAGDLAEYLRYWGSVYSLTDTEHYELLKEKYLDPVECAELIRKNDIVHYDVMENVQSTLEKCMEKGIDIAIYSNSGIRAAMGGDENCDILLRVKDVTGAETTNLGKRFADGYTGKKTSCDNPGHHHVSPSLEVDASTAYLPENTWFVDGSHHAMFQFESYGLELNAKLLCTDEIKDIYSDPDYPQFMSSRNSHRGVYASFDDSSSGYYSEKDKTLRIENLYVNNEIKILSVKLKGTDIELLPEESEVIPVGSEIEIDIDGMIPEDISRFGIEVKFKKMDTFDTVNDRTFDFSVIGGGEGSSDGSVVDDEFFQARGFNKFSVKRFVYRIVYTVEISFEITDFLLSEAFSYLF